MVFQQRSDYKTLVSISKRLYVRGDQTARLEALTNTVCLPGYKCAMPILLVRDSEVLGIKNAMSVLNEDSSEILVTLMPK